MHRTVAVLACLLAHGPLLYAQGAAGAAMLPRDLVVALTSYGDEADIRAGAMAPGLPLETVPANATLLGSLVQMHGSTTAFIAAGSRESVLEEIEARLVAARWRRARDGYLARGFIPPNRAAPVRVLPRR